MKISLSNTHKLKIKLKGGKITAAWHIGVSGEFLHILFSDVCLQAQKKRLTEYLRSFDGMITFIQTVNTVIDGACVSTKMFND